MIRGCFQGASTRQPLGILAFFVLLVGAGISLSVWYVPLRHRLLAQSGQAVIGVVNKKFKSLDPSIPGYQIAYEYSVSGISHTAIMDASVDDFVKIVPGSSITVLYDRTDPNNSAIYLLSYYLARF